MGTDGKAEDKWLYRQSYGEDYFALLCPTILVSFPVVSFVRSILIL